MSPFKKEIIELVLSNPRKLTIEDVADHFDPALNNAVHRAVLELHVDDDVIGFTIDWKLYVYKKPPPYVGEG